MKFEYSSHWARQRKYRPEITDDIIEQYISNSDKLLDRDYVNTFNAIAKIYPSGRTLKVAYKEKSKTIKIITAYWLD